MNSDVAVAGIILSIFLIVLICGSIIIHSSENCRNYISVIIATLILVSLAILGFLNLVGLAMPNFLFFRGIP